jgi:hypothetical protein
MVLARVPRQRVLERAAYEFYAGTEPGGGPRWAAEIADRAAVLAIPKGCYRSGVTFDAGIGRYLWVVVIPVATAGAGRNGSLSIFDAPEPWGPWTTAYHAGSWDVDTGETASFPSRWMLDGGRTLHLVFSGEDSFSVRRCRLTPR